MLRSVLRHRAAAQVPLGVTSLSKRSVQVLAARDQQRPLAWPRMTKCEMSSVPMNAREMGDSTTGASGGGYGGGYGDAGKPQLKVFVGNLSWDTDEESVREFFRDCGATSDVFFPTDRETGQFRGFCFITFDDLDGAAAAVALAGQELDGRELRIDYSQPKPDGGGKGKGGKGKGGKGGQGKGGKGKGKGSRY